MNWKKLGMIALLSTLAVPAYAKVVTGSQTDMNMDLKYPLVYTENAIAQTAINTDIAAYVGKPRTPTIIVTFTKYRKAIK